MAGGGQYLCGDCLELKPQHASLFDLVRIFSSAPHELERERFVETTNAAHVRGLERRCLIFISVSLQKLLLHLRKPMAWIGYALALWLNLLSSNGGGFRLLLRKLWKGSVVWPDKESAKFVSVIGHLDTRLELDNRITSSDSRYGASLSMMAAKLSYENQALVQTIIRDHWKMEFLEYFSFWNEYQDKYSTKAIMFRDTTSKPDLIVVAFQGTEPFDADQWRTDVDLSWQEVQGAGRVHSGFMKALGMLKKLGWPKEVEQGSGGQLLPLAYYTIREKLRELLSKNEAAKFIVTGHSLGGALAVLFMAVLGLHEESWLLERLDAVYTFGQPRVGDEQFGEFMKRKMRVYDVKYYRYVYANDLVPRLPYDYKNLLYKHFGPCLYFNSCYKGKVVCEEPNKNYFSLWWAIPGNFNAVWELIRSFIIPYIKGRDYREGWFLRLFRVIGLAIPGLADHGPQDYDNVTRLGSLPPQFSKQVLKYGENHD